MKALYRAFVLGWLLTVAPTVAAAEKLAAGNYELAVLTSGATEMVQCIIKVEHRDGKCVGTLLAANPRTPGITIDRFTVEGDEVSVTVAGPGLTQRFVGRIAADDSGVVKGVMGEDRRMNMAHLTKTTKDSLAQNEGFKLRDLPTAMRQANAMSSRGNTLRLQAARETDQEKKKKLLEEATEAEKVAREQLPKLYRDVIAHHGDSLAAGDAARFLISSAARNKATADEVRSWVETVVKVATPYGPAWVTEQRLRAAEVLVSTQAYAPIALELAAAAEKALDNTASIERQVRVLTVLANAETKTGSPAAAQTKARLDKMEGELDKDYLTKVPPFKPATFAGRKSDSTRTVVMELFTGAQCPPCVAADVAFDALIKTYKPSDVIFLQYHLHIPGPDPLTNTDTVARFNHYRKTFADQLRGTPSTLFNGKPAAGGGGGMARAEPKYGEYRKIIDPLLEEPAVGKVEVSATRNGQQIDIVGKVSGLNDPNDHLRLRFVLVEESIRYVGGNNLRFHHHVVRAFPGGVAGLPVKPGQEEYKASVNLNDLRGKLTAYLDSYAAERPFPKSDRPMDFKHLSIVALVQNDETHEILDAEQVDVSSESARK